MKICFLLTLLFTTHLVSAGTTPQLMGQCQKLLQHYESFWRHDAYELFYRLHDRKLNWKLEGKRADRKLMQFLFQGHSDPSEFHTRIRLKNDVLVMEILNETTNEINFYPLAAAELVTNIEATHYATDGDDDNQTSSLAFAMRSYSFLQYPIEGSSSLTLAINVLATPRPPKIFLGRKTKCTDPSATEFWFNVQGKRFCFKPLAQLTE